MNDIYITLTGNVAAEPRQYSFEDGSRVTSLKVFSSHRYFDKKTGQWMDGDRVCFTVRCWRTLGDNVASSIRAGHPVVVSGKLRIREFGPEGDRRFVPEIEANAVGHDLRWGTGMFTKPDRSGTTSMSREMRDRLDDETRDWAMGSTRSVRSLARSGSMTEANPFHALEADRSLGTDYDAVRTPAADGVTPPTLGDEGNTVRSVSEESSTVRSLREEGSTAGSLSGEGSTAGSLSGEGSTAGSLSGEGSAVRSSEAEDGTTRSVGDENRTLRSLGAEGGTVRILGAEADETTSMGDGDEDGDAEQLTMEERVAA
ncbi:single-stranded DNA-binding protein [Nonomuraea sp. B19D2]|uniref:single-stranded DNA-binding protein n=1 Tax=Nonomuraea sp. B19D2 TaxID=3159561 RepID=UPI0032DA59C4